MYRKFIKRILDVTLSGSALLILSPVYLVLYILVRMKLGAPVFYCAERIGKGEKPFKLYKFRSMTDARDANGNPLPDIERLTPFGRKLRASSLDELPEFWNVFNGTMSLIGPRPLPPIYLPYYNEQERIRHTVRPGITGLAQVNGRNSVQWARKFEYDVQYAKNITFVNDLKIVFQTILVVLKHKDIGQGEEAPKSFHIVRQAEWDKSGKK